MSRLQTPLLLAVCVGLTAWLYQRTTSVGAFDNLRGCTIFVTVLAVLTGVVMQTSIHWLENVVRRQRWWPRAAPLQKALMMNFGYQEVDCDDEACLNNYCFVLLFCGHHILCGVAMLPVVVRGWEGSGTVWQLCFLVAGLADVALDVYDWLKTFCLTFFPARFRFLGVRVPLGFFVVVACLHHPLAMSMMIPMLLYYPSLRAFHFLAVSLLLAAGVCFVSGAYKFTLDTSTREGFLRYKCILVLQLVTIWLTRGLIWFFQGFALLRTFWAEGAMGFLAGACVGGVLMSLFNVVMLKDSLDAARKWLPRSMPPGGEAERKELQRQAVRSMSGEMLAATAAVEALSPEARKFHAAATVVLAVQKFKRGVRHKQVAGRPTVCASLKRGRA